eukprot:TRINITY_DN11692_c0_g1_i1.p1 TRINITY_DN11692_c0_g1~~TRINITY_DN11692_c0_g1_i1.p1  ORF type:complete len:384 (+),score=87.61 TRINITY_DN11692_c0_g1_i1:759-1910(+)
MGRPDPDLAEKAVGRLSLDLSGLRRGGHEITADKAASVVQKQTEQAASVTISAKRGFQHKEYHMPVSMTGFGRFETNDDAWTHVWEIKSVNGRFLDVKWRMPGYLRSLENGWEKVLRTSASRGRVDVALNLEVLDARILGVTFNETMAQAMFDQMEKLAASRGESFEPDYNRVLSMPSLWRDCGTEPDPGLAESLTRGLEAAITAWVDSRAKEGDALVADLMDRFNTLRDLTEKVKQRIPDILEAKKTALRQRIIDMLESANAEFSEDRMLQEVAYLTDKLDVSEELTRLDAHLERLGEVLTEQADVGKKLDFLVQETFREINTCGNKAQDTEVSRLVVDFKAELERCREQVQNIEQRKTEEAVGNHAETGITQRRFRKFRCS